MSNILEAYQNNHSDNKDLHPVKDVKMHKRNFFEDYYPQLSHLRRQIHKLIVR